MTNKEKLLNNKLVAKENEIVREAKLYCATHDIEFNREHNKILRVCLRNFFKHGVYPNLRDLFDTNLKYYSDENPK